MLPLQQRRIEGAVDDDDLEEYIKSSCIPIGKYPPGLTTRLESQVRDFKQKEASLLQLAAGLPDNGERLFKSMRKQREQLKTAMKKAIEDQSKDWLKQVGYGLGF